jgi:hypothetical protein
MQPAHMMQPFKFEKVQPSSNKFSMILEGEIGSGKSTVGTELIYLHCLMNRNEKYEQDEHIFRIGNDSTQKRYTNSTAEISIGEISITDTPGTNDKQQLGTKDHEIDNMK